MPDLSNQNADQPENQPVSCLTKHASRRMQHRGISSDAVDAVLVYGRRVYTRGAVIYAIGRKEVAECRELDIDLKGYEGVQVVCATDGEVLTVYRNRDFRGLRPGLGRGRHRKSPPSVAAAC